MAEPQGVTNLDDILYDLDGSEKCAAQIARFSSAGPAVASRWRQLVIPGRGSRGADLLTRRPTDLQMRYATLMRMEAQFAGGLEYGFLIGPACQVLEAELDLLLTTPARGIAEALVTVLAVDNRKQADILSGWADGRFPATIGTASLILLALRRGLERDHPLCRDFLAGHFHPEYTTLLAAKYLGSTLDRIREQFRNPACHGTRSFDAAAYEEFVRLTVANCRFADWRDRGSLADAVPGRSGLLDVHLRQSRLVPPTSSEAAPLAPLERLLALAAPRQSNLTVSLEPRPATGLQLRNISVSPPRLNHPFRLGDAIRFVYRANRDAQVVLIDAATSGTVCVLLPNVWKPQARARAGDLHALPDLVSPEFEFTLSGQPGRERVLALALLAEPPISLQPEGSALFRQLAPAEMTALADGLTRLPADEWAACACEFDILPG